MPAVRAALLPHPPLLVPDLAGGAAAELDQLRSACREALASVLAVSRAVVVIGEGPVWGVASRGARGSFAPYGTDVEVGLPGGPLPLDLPSLPEPVRLDALPLSLAVAAWLLGSLDADADADGWAAAEPGHVPSTAGAAEPAEPVTSPAAVPSLAAVAVPSALGPGAAVAVGRELARAVAASGPVGVIAMGDLSARRSAKAPGAFHPAAARFDAGVARAVAAGDLHALATLDLGLAGELMVAGRAVLQVLAGTMEGAGALHGRILYDDAPYGVGYVVAVLTAAPGTKRQAAPPQAR